MARIVVLGGGESGVGAAVLAKVKGFDVFLSDKETSYSTDENGGVSLGDFEEVLAAIKITGGDITVFKPVKIAGDNDMTISTSTGAKINITASGETTVFDVQAGGSLTLGGENSGSVIITGDSSVGNPYNFDGDYSLITVSGGTVNIGENTEIKDNKAGRGVNVTSGNLYMTGGTISGNTGNTSLCPEGKYVITNLRRIPPLIPDKVEAYVFPVEQLLH